MAIKLKLKQVTAPAQEIEESVQQGVAPSTSNEAAALIDKLGAKAALVEKAKAQIKKLQDTLLKPYAEEMKLLCDLISQDTTHGDDEEYVAAGDVFEIEVSKAGNVRELADPESAIKFLNKAVKGDPKLGFKLASIKLGDLDKYLTPVELDTVLKKSKGPRYVKVVRKRMEQAA